MASAIFDVTPEELESSAQKIATQAAEFESTYKSIYTAVSDLRLSYKGESSDAFNKQIEGYRNDFEQAKGALDKYVEFLKYYAKNMKNKENDIKSRASSLKIGK